VSNFSVAQMRQVGEVGTIDAHQLGYNLFWRVPEADVIPYCVERGIPVVTYGSIAQGILTGKFPRDPVFPPGDARPQTVLFDPGVWPHLRAATEELKEVAAEAGRPLAHLAIQWCARRPGVAAVIVGARSGRQARENAAAMRGDVAPELMARVQAVGDRVRGVLPDEWNFFRFDP
jgi:aryl-alcohol dehydrogenase-like predicted oxidoreductase